MSRIFSLFIILIISSPVFAYMELHSHAFMKEGMGALFRGHFDGELEARSWKDMLNSNINDVALDKSGIRIFVAALYAHPILVLSPGKSWREGVKESIRAQIKLAQEFVQKFPEWKLARNVDEASAFYKNGFKVMILSLEGAHAIFEGEKDFKEFIDESGISIVTPIHLINNDYGGAAYMGGFRKSFFTLKNIYFRKSNGAKVNPKGLSVKGRELFVQLLQRGVWIDLSHMSDQAIEDALPILDSFRQPLLFTHTSLRKYYKDERGISQAHLELVKARGGFVGLVPSEEMLVNTQVSDEYCPKECRPCKGGIEALAQHFGEIEKIVGEGRVSFGSDFSGGIPHLSPPRCLTPQTLSNKGLVSIDQMGEVYRGVGLRLKNELKPDKMAREFFLQWERTKAWRKEGKAILARAKK